MAIESMSAANAAANVVQPSQQPQQADKVQRQPVEPQNNERYQQQAKQTQEVSAEKLEAAIDRLNEMMKSGQRSLNFSVDSSSEKVVVQVRDLSTDQVIRQIPNEEALRFAESLDRMMGLIFNEEA
ncbi:flagellar protein FlaG [Neptuniibacter caesariensis]|uniref:Flagellar protein FlaG protein n=1 Tax=Neptuniibacter caesariensis TaxID=207954 RepID=A0A7U8C445_NEPCE|nr:flagellar protein FlaG [Neptuniibacter caesariensis]EAR60084.1 Flagellar protein FlaG protein [Oceanospirillum sp. MED92] [Neptuniibacter caesariensis]